MTKISAAVRAEVRKRAGSRCEYCCLPDKVSSYPFHIEHIRARKHSGSDMLDNLAWSCFQCNTAKGSDVASYDPATDELTLLFNPRRDNWNDHFELVDGVIKGKTPTGRVTEKLLHINLDEQLILRRNLIANG